MSTYGTDQGFKDYFAARGIDVTGITDAVIAANRLVASEWLDGHYRSMYPGEKYGEREQIRDWPRYDAYDVNGDYIEVDAVPIEIEYATYEVARKAAVTPSVLNADYTPPKYKSVAVSGAVSVNYVQFDNVSETQVQFAAVNQILSGILDFNRGGVSRLSGMTVRV